jgi:hypothetical protein
LSTSIDAESEENGWNMIPAINAKFPVSDHTSLGCLSSESCETTQFPVPLSLVRV